MNARYQSYSIIIQDVMDYNPHELSKTLKKMAYSNQLRQYRKTLGMWVPGLMLSYYGWMMLKIAHTNLNKLSQVLKAKMMSEYVMGLALGAGDGSREMPYPMLIDQDQDDVLQALGFRRRNGSKTVMVRDGERLLEICEVCGVENGREIFFDVTRMIEATKQAGHSILKNQIVKVEERGFPVWDEDGPWVPSGWPNPCIDWNCCTDVMRVERVERVKRVMKVE